MNKQTLQNARWARCTLVSCWQQEKLYCSHFTLSVKYKLFEIYSIKIWFVAGKALFIKRDKTSLHCGVRIRKITVLFHKNLGIPQASWLNSSLTKHICTPTLFSTVQWCFFCSRNFPGLSSILFLTHQCFCVFSGV